MARRQNTRSEQDEALRKRGGAWFQTQRNALGMTQLEVTKYFGYQYYTFISQIESGQGKLPEDQWENAAKLFKLTPAYFAKKQLVFYYPFIFKCLYGVPTEKDLSVQE